MDPAIISALIGLFGVLLIGACQGGYVLYTRWTSRTRQVKATVDQNRDAKNEEIGALRAELRANKQLIRRLERDIAYLRAQNEQCWEQRR